jgi:hypothetical protein
VEIDDLSERTEAILVVYDTDSDMGCRRPPTECLVVDSPAVRQLVL